MAYFMKNIVIPTSLSFFFLLFSSSSWSETDILQTKQRIIDQRNNWLEETKTGVITAPPEKESKTAELDRIISNNYQAITGERRELAEADKSQDHSYVFNTYANILFGNNAKSINFNDIQAYQDLNILHNTGTYAYDPNKKRARSIDFILKELFSRGRPYQVIDKEGNYLDNYTSITGSSYPSGHTWNGYKQAAVLSILFPEKGSEIFARAIEYGESRVIVGAHFATDTIASRIGNYYLLSQMLANDDTTRTFVKLAKEVRQNVANQCKNQNCLSPSKEITNDEAGYYGTKDPETSSLISPNKIPGSASNLLRLRFAYLTKEQRQSILASTAYPSNSLAGWASNENDPDSSWGLINLPKAYNGPSYFYNHFIVNQTTNEFDFAEFGKLDEWKNDISGPGKLIKQGDGTLILSGNNHFAGVEVNQGNLLLTGENNYSKNSAINGGTLLLEGKLNSLLDVNKGTLLLNDGSVNSQVSINDKGILSGKGKINQLKVNSGGMVSPGHSIGTININDTVIFNSGSHYHVEINTQGDSDKITSLGTAVLNGGTVNVSLENNQNLLTKNDVQSLYNTKYTILTANKGINGKFTDVNPNYLFIGTTLSYDQNAVILNIGRNNTAFSSLAKTNNQTSIANAIEVLPSGHPVYESIVRMDIKHDVRSAYNELTGQIHADVLSNQLNSSRQIKEILLTQVKNAEDLKGEKESTDNKGNVWAKVLYNWEDSSSDGNANSYDTSTYGILLGADQRFNNDKMLLGIATGFTKTSLSGYNSHANSENYHLSLYGGYDLAPFTLRTGASNTFHRVHTSKTVNYASQSDKNNAHYDGNTSQIFIEAAYPITLSDAQLEPFVNLEYAKTKNATINEQGGRAALQAHSQSLDSTTSTTGLRLNNQWKLNSKSNISLYGELGWLHQYNDVERGINLRFTNTQPTFTANSVDTAQDALVVKAGTTIKINEISRVSIGYSGLTAKNQQNNSVDMKVSISF
ncbi:autotransporter outer membrane beta-barrel domain-containing protein [Proteus terrae subsp. cibarius]|uniref:Autotransporter domain-containing protein n=1 Tax=Proteus terrae subsp. cibarius TaxID=626774 RepID=A0ABX6JMV9_9GAMM|nr:autotransporter domain-containing protein [Proteus terrae]QGW02756.1 autotransporter outer membrane beta-barrel domain-containing protein [Proteus terrae subsp. cibarius]QIF90232.1 autotransporter domain-containing protein [Proteus terrae subsp. cibarius]